MRNTAIDWDVCRGLAKKRDPLFLDETIKSILSFQSEYSLGNAVALISNCSGKLVTSGMGKAGHVAKKASSSFSSLGIPSVYLHPGEASHGDIGVIQPQDILLVFSTSGKTREVLETVHFAKNLNVSSVISITSHVDSEIRPLSDVVIDMGAIKESGHLNIAPTTSIVVMLIIADMLAVISAEAKGFTMEGYAARHHSGYLGNKSRGEIGNADDEPRPSTES